VLLSLAENVSAKAARRYVGGTYVKFYKKRELLRKYVEYRLILLRNYEVIRKFLKASLTKRQYEVFRKIMFFPIRPTKYYAKKLGYSIKGPVCWAVSAIVKRILHRLYKRANEVSNEAKRFIYLTFLDAFKEIVFGGRLKKW